MMTAFVARLGLMLAALPATRIVWADDGSIDEIRAAWQQRQDRFGTFAIEWKEARTTMAGTKWRDSTSGYPSADVIHLVQHRMTAEGERLRYSRTGEFYDIDLRRFAHKDYTFVFDGTESRDLFTGEKESRHPPGFVARALTFPGASDYHVAGVIFAFRPLVEALSGIDLTRCQFASQRGIVDGIDCHILEAHPTDRISEAYWLAGSGDWRILRHDRTLGGRTFSQLTIRYEDRDVHGFVPIGWQHMSIDEHNGRVEQTLVSEVERLDVGRATPRPEFELQFPPGAVVQGPGKNEIAVVRRDGTLRPVTQGELAMGISFDDLMESSPVSESVQRRPFWRDRTAAIAAVALVLIAAVLIVLRLRQRT